MEKLLQRYTTFDLMLIALMAALGLAAKPLVVPLAHLLTGPLFIPGGAVAGGFYMLWLVLSGSLVQKRGAATLTALVQGIIVLVSGLFGSHGVASLFTYALPGLAVDLLWLALRSRGEQKLACFLAGIAANLSGTFLSNLVFFRLPFLPLLLSLTAAALSGGLGGLIAWQISDKVNRLRGKDHRKIAKL